MYQPKNGEPRIKVSSMEAKPEVIIEDKALVGNKK